MIGIDEHKVEAPVCDEASSEWARRDENVEPIGERCGVVAKGSENVIILGDAGMSRNAGVSAPRVDAKDPSAWHSEYKLQQNLRAAVTKPASYLGDPAIWSHDPSAQLRERVRVGGREGAKLSGEYRFCRRHRGHPLEDRAEGYPVIHVRASVRTSAAKGMT